MSQTFLFVCAAGLWGSLAALVLAAPAVLPVLLLDEVKANRRHAARS